MKTKVAVVGAQGHFHYVADAQGIEDFEVICLAPGFEDEDMSAVQTAFPQARMYRDYHALLSSEQMDVAVINSRFDLNCDMAELFLRRGIHVYCEKPIATSMEKLTSIERILRHSPGELAAMFDGPCQPWFAALQTAVQAGEIGKIRMMHAQKSYRMGQRPAYFCDPHLYGGMLPWVGIHGIQWLCTLDSHRVIHVSAAQDSGENRHMGGMQTTAACILTFDDGVIGLVTADYYRPEGAKRHDDDRIRVTGTQGMIEVVDGRVYLENAMPRRELPVPEAQQPFAMFLRDVRTGKAAWRTREALEVTRIALQARDAAFMKAKTE